MKPLFIYLSDTINARPALVAGLFVALILLAFYGTGLLRLHLPQGEACTHTPCPIIMIVGSNGLIKYTLHIDYTPLTATLGSQAIGIACKYTILIMERFHEELDTGRPLYDAINTSVSQIGSAISVSGFSTPLLSGFDIISNFGMVTVITVGFSLIGAIIVMPAVLACHRKQVCNSQITPIFFTSSSTPVLNES